MKTDLNCLEMDWFQFHPPLNPTISSVSVKLMQNAPKA